MATTTSVCLLVSPWILYFGSPCSKFGTSEAPALHISVAAMESYGLEFARTTDSEDEGEMDISVLGEGFPGQDWLAGQVAGDGGFTRCNPRRNCCRCKDETSTDFLW